MHTTQGYSLLLLLILVLLAKDIHKILTHEIFLFFRPVISLTVFKEAKEEGVHCHCIDIKEGAGNEEGGDGDDDDRCEVVVHLWKVRPNSWHLSAEDKEGGHTNAADHNHLANEEQEVCHLCRVGGMNGTEG